jgi:hypothetical protein
MRLVLECSVAQADEVVFDELEDVWMAVVQTVDGPRARYWRRGGSLTGALARYCPSLNRDASLVTNWTARG